MSSYPGSDAHSAGPVAVSSVQQSEPETVSDINWGNIILVFLFLLWIILLLSTIVIAVARGQRGQAKAEEAEGTDLEVQQQQNENKINSNYQRLSRASFIPIIAGTVAFALSIVPHMTCQFLDILSDDSDLLSFGMWSVSYEYFNDDFGGDGKCYTNYPVNFEVNAAFNIARASAIISSVMGGICMLMLLYYCMTKAGREVLSLRSLPTPLLFVAFFQALTLSAFGAAECDAESCGFLFGSIAALSGALYWSLCAGSIFILSLREGYVVVNSDQVEGST